MWTILYRYRELPKYTRLAFPVEWEVWSRYREEEEARRTLNLLAQRQKYSHIQLRLLGPDGRLAEEVSA